MGELNSDYFLFSVSQNLIFSFLSLKIWHKDRRYK